MSDFRIFCWGTFLGMTLTAILLDFGWQRAAGAQATDGEAIIILGLALGAAAVLAFGKREATNDRD